MAAIDSMQTLFREELRDLYDAENRLTKAIPKLVRKATHDELKAALEEHLEETEGQVARLEKAFERLGEQRKGKPRAGMRGIIEEGDEHLSAGFADKSLRDIVIIGSAQRVEHDEMSAYGTAIAHARLLGVDGHVVDLLEESLAEEKAADNRLTQIAPLAARAFAVSGDRPEGTAEFHPGPLRA
jgi:ferritin-like metal-binding protein YciE